jgi:hypothetical protein
LSDPRDEELVVWREVWADLPAARRRWIANRLFEATEADFQVAFKRLFVEMLGDADAEVRALALDGLWEAEDVRLMHRFVEILKGDLSALVRARAAAALGTYVRLGQLDRISGNDARLALYALADAAGDESEDPDVRRRATESAGFAEYSEVGGLIEAAIESDLPGMRAGALRAMGNSADERWEPEVTAFLESPVPELRFEAARAAGELVLSNTVPLLVALTEDVDLEIKLEAVWALGEIGGDMAKGVLENMHASADDPDLEDAIEDALSAMALSEGEMPWSDLLEADAGVASPDTGWVDGSWEDDADWGDSQWQDDDGFDNRDDNRDYARDDCDDDVDDDSDGDPDDGDLTI